MKLLTPVESGILEELLQDQENGCKGPLHPEAKPEIELPFDVMTQLAEDRRVQAYECEMCSTDDTLVYHDRITPAGRLALRLAKTPP